jgi:hypothetical protein
MLKRRRAQLGAGGAARSGREREAVLLARALDAALDVRGYRRPRSRSPVGFADDLERLGAPVAPLARRVAERYAAARFGDAPLLPGEFEALRRELRQAPNPAA